MIRSCSGTPVYMYAKAISSKAVQTYYMVEYSALLDTMHRLQSQPNTNLME